jgi:hypothetical protein
VFDASRVAFSLLAPWRRRPETTLRARLIAVNDTSQNETAETDTVDLILDLAGMQIEPPTGTPDVTLRVVIADLVRSRQTGEPLVGRLTGDASSRRIFLDQFRLEMAKR